MLPDLGGGIRERPSVDRNSCRARAHRDFDNDGTLWCEQPLQVQFFFAHERRKTLLDMDPDLKDCQPFEQDYS